MTLTKQFAPIRDWAAQRGLYEKGDSKTQFTKLGEEMGELAKAILSADKPKKRTTEIKDAVGDMVVVLTNLARMEGLNIEDCINHAFNQIKDRKGKMIGGTFVKSAIGNLKTTDY